MPSWPILNQIRNRDLFGLDGSARSARSDSLRARTATADRVARSLCPYCAVGCGQLVYVKDEKIIDIEGDPASPISHGCLCRKRSATFQLVTGGEGIRGSFKARMNQPWHAPDCGAIVRSRVSATTGSGMR